MVWIAKKKIYIHILFYLLHRDILKPWKEICLTPKNPYQMLAIVHNTFTDDEFFSLLMRLEHFFPSCEPALLTQAVMTGEQPADCFLEKTRVIGMQDAESAFYSSNTSHIFSSLHSWNVDVTPPECKICGCYDLHVLRTEFVRREYKESSLKEFLLSESFTAKTNVCILLLWSRVNRVLLVRLCFSE